MRDQLLLAGPAHARAARRDHRARRAASCTSRRSRPGSRRPARRPYAATKAAISAWAECMAGRPPRHRRRGPRREPRRDRHRAVPPARQRPAADDGRRDAARSTRWSSPCSAMIETGQVRGLVPDWFNGVYAGKYKDVDASSTAPSPSPARKAEPEFETVAALRRSAARARRVSRGAGRSSWSRGTPRSRRRRARGRGRSPCSRRTASRGRTTCRRSPTIVPVRIRRATPQRAVERSRSSTAPDRP